MKQQKRIIEHLIQQSKPQSHSIRVPVTEKQPANIEVETIQTAGNQQIPNISQQLTPAFTLEVSVEIGDGRCDTVFINEKSDPYREAENFCNKHKLESYIAKLLGDSLAEQTRKQKIMIKQNLNSKSSEQKVSKSKIVQKPLSSNRLFKSNKNSQQLLKSPQCEFTGHPKINQVSEQIVKKMGKNKIIELTNKKFHDKVQQHIMQKLEKQERKLQTYSFHPHINPISRKVDETLNNSRVNGVRHEHLYEQYRLIQNRKQERRRNSTMEMPFKPMINKVSRTIMTKKKSLGDLCGSNTSSNIKVTIKPKNEDHIFHEQEQKKISKQKTKERLSSSAEQLCYHLYEQAKKRKEKVEKQTERMYKNNENNWKIMQNSNCLITTARQNKIKQVFYHLSKPPHKSLHHSEINFSTLTQLQKIFMPVFQQMIDIDTDLTEDQFVQSGVRLLKYLTPHEKSVLTRRNSKIEQSNKENNIGCSINKRSRQIIKQKGYGQKNIYIRGLMFQKEMKTQIQKGQKEKIKKQLQGCTFKPKIHGIPLTIGY